MKEHPRLFKGSMVRALLNGTKTQTRRLDIKAKLEVGDMIWVKETWAPCECGHPICHGILYRASGDSAVKIKWKSSLFMSRKQSRILLEITALREERLQDITDDDARAEGVAEYAKTLPDELTEEMTRQEGYRHLWESINGPGSWDENPMVKVISFKVVKP